MTGWSQAMNKQFEISVGETWDFEVPDGQNKIFAVAKGIVSGPDKLNWDKEYCLLRVITPFKMDGELVTRLIASPRYMGDTLNKMISEGEWGDGLKILRFSMVIFRLLYVITHHSRLSYKPSYVEL